MASQKSNLYILICLVFISSALFSISIADSDTQLQARRDLDEASNKQTIFILAAQRTRRRDPLNGFKFYTGGWNITNGHYLSSVLYSAAPPLIVGAFWLALFGICLCCMIIRRCCLSRKEHYSYSRIACALSLILILLFTITTVWGSVYIYKGHHKFENSVVDVVSYVLKKVDDVVTNLSEVINYLVSAKKIGIGKELLPADLLAKVDEVQNKTNTFADKMRKVTKKNSDDIRKFTGPVRTALFCITTFMLVMAILGLLFSVIGLSSLVFVLMILGWFAVFVTFLMSGLFLFVHNATSDTCVAMDEWLHNPTAASVIETIIPRANNEVAQIIYSSTKGVTFGIVNITNVAIQNIYNVDSAPQIPFYAHRSGPPVPLLCNPFNLDLTDRKCVNGEVELKDASQVYKNFMCQTSNDICTTPGRITPSNYNDLTASIDVSYGLYRYSPFLINLLDSTYIKESFSSISKNNCPSLLRSTQWMHIGFTVIAVSVMCSMFLWVVFGREYRHRKTTKKMMASPEMKDFGCMKAV